MSRLQIHPTHLDLKYWLSQFHLLCCMALCCGTCTFNAGLSCIIKYYKAKYGIKSRSILFPNTACWLCIKNQSLLFDLFYSPTQHMLLHWVSLNSCLLPCFLVANFRRFHWFILGTKDMASTPIVGYFFNCFHLVREHLSFMQGHKFVTLQH